MSLLTLTVTSLGKLSGYSRFIYVFVTKTVEDKYFFLSEEDCLINFLRFNYLLERESRHVHASWGRGKEREVDPLQSA